MSITKAFTNLAKSSGSALTHAATYVENKIDEKRKREFQNKLSAKRREDFGAIMTDDEYEQQLNNIEQWKKIAAQSNSNIEDIDNKNAKSKSKETKDKQTNKINNQNKNKRNLESTDIEKYRPSFWEELAVGVWRRYEASKRDDTALINFSHHIESKGGNVLAELCKKKIKKEYDKRYGEFFCIDNYNAKDPDIYDKMIDSMEKAIEKNLKYFKLYIGSDGGKDDYISLQYSMDDLKKLLALFSGEFDGKTVIFVKTACYDGDKNDDYNFDFEEVVKTFSQMNPKTTVVMAEHVDKETYHYELNRRYSKSHFDFAYRIMINGTAKSVTKDEKNNYIGGSFKKKPPYSPLEDYPWKTFCCFVPTVILLCLSYFGKEGIEACCKKCKERRRKRQLAAKAQRRRSASTNIQSNSRNTNNNNNNANILNINTNINTEIRRLNKPNRIRIRSAGQRGARKKDVNNRETNSVVVYNRKGI